MSLGFETKAREQEREKTNQKNKAKSTHMNNHSPWVQAILAKEPKGSLGNVLPTRSF